MTLLAGILFLVSSLLAWHCVKTGRSKSWVYLILFLPFVGSVLYVFTQLLPELRAGSARPVGGAGPAAGSGRTAIHVVKSVEELKDRKYKLLAADAALPDNDGVLKCREQLADECVQAELYEDAEALYQASLQGDQRTDPRIQLKLAQVLFAQDLFARCRVQLEELITDNPDFRSPEGHLLYARALEALNDRNVVEEYEALLTNYPGEEAQVRYALYLQTQGEFTRAHKLFTDCLARCRRASGDYQRSQAPWITIARAQLQKPPHDPVH